MQAQDGLTSQEEQQLVDNVEQGFETLFTEVVRETSPGVWEVDPEAAARYGISLEKANALARMMEGKPIDSSGGHTRQKRDLQSFARCVAYDALGLPLNPEDAYAVGQLLKQKRWRDAARKIVSTAAIDGSANLLKYGVMAVGGWPAIAAKIAISAGACGLSERT
ncbi:hypothetical protein [Corynebacterium gerontici]|uniref:Uncharacterized protein n=1 Tax=Corynebacterium gerontici TaxID=2079234 RepID=A0A3G6J2G4_9CORY|nr:hypothetical protein [Corynebacterium gerontici]AZA12139.1 hypothetical protein CGERO_09240 [Corynebacterium gerontici]